MGTGEVSDDGFWDWAEVNAQNERERDDDNVVAIPTDYASARLSHPALAPAHGQTDESDDFFDRMRPRPSVHVPPTDPPDCVSGLTELGDERFLLYRGRAHVFAGPPGSGKSWVAMYAARWFIKNGEKVWWLDPDGFGEGDVRKRLMLIGVSEDELHEYLMYAQHDMSAPELGPLIHSWAEEDQPRLVVIDSWGPSINANIAGSTNEDSDVDRWKFVYIDGIRRACPGVTHLIIDHPPKNDANNDQKGLTGSQRKRGCVDTVALVRMNSGAILSEQDEGEITIRGQHGGGKDRFGGWTWDKIGPVKLVITPDPSGSYVARMVFPDPAAPVKPWQPTAIMERVCEYVMDNPGASQTAIETGVSGKVDYIRKAIAELVAGSYIVVETKGQSKRHTVMKMYRETGYTSESDGLTSDPETGPMEQDEFPF